MHVNEKTFLILYEKNDDFKNLVIDGNTVNLPAEEEQSLQIVFFEVRELKLIFHLTLSGDERKDILYSI